MLYRRSLRIAVCRHRQRQRQKEIERERERDRERDRERERERDRERSGGMEGTAATNGILFGFCRCRTYSPDGERRYGERLT